MTVYIYAHLKPVVLLIIALHAYAQGLALPEPTLTEGCPL